MIYFLLKATHIVGFVAWFGGLFYLGRILVYHREALEMKGDERKVLLPQYHLMESRAYSIIVNPAMNLTWICGLSMIILNGMEWFKENHWLHVKLVLLLFLTIYQISLKNHIKLLNSENPKFTSYQFRLYNEVPTLFLFSIVFLAVFKQLLHFGYAILGLIILAVFLWVATKLYRKFRNRS